MSRASTNTNGQDVGKTPQIKNTHAISRIFWFRFLPSETRTKHLVHSRNDLGGSDPVSTFGRQNRTNTGVLYNGDVKKKHFPFRKEEGVFLTSSSRPTLRGEHARILVVAAGTFCIMSPVVTAEHPALQSSVIWATTVLSETRGLSLYRVVRGGIWSLVRLKA